MFDIHAPIILQGCTYFADKNVMKGSLLDNLGWCRPTAFLGVPRVWEKIMEKMLEKARDIKGLKKKIGREAKKVGLKCNTEERQTTMFKVFQKIYYTKVKTLLGLDQCVLFVTGAAPISREVCLQGAVIRLTYYELFRLSTTSCPWTSSSQSSTA